MNTILIVLIVVVIYLIHTTFQKKDTFGIVPNEIVVLKDDDKYSHEPMCYSVTTLNDCENPYYKSMCRDKCGDIRGSFSTINQKKS